VHLIRQSAGRSFRRACSMKLSSTIRSFPFFLTRVLLIAIALAGAHGIETSLDAGEPI